MSTKDVLSVVVYLIGALGGGSAIVYKCSSFLGRVWSEKHLEAMKKDFQKEIESHRNELDILKQARFRYSDKQFELYNQFYHSLYKLKICGDILWEQANQRNINQFSSQLKKTINEIEMSYLFIEYEHYRELKTIIDEFSSFHVGKTSLISRRIHNETVDYYELERIIRDNKNIKVRYEALLDNIREDLKRQIRGQSILESNNNLKRYVAADKRA